MTYNAGQVVEVCSERSRGWVSFGYGSKITLERLIPPDAGYAGQWEAVTATGVRGIISEKEFRPIPEHSPIRTETVTVRRLEPGVYGRLYVRGEGDYPFGQEKQADIGFTSRGATDKDPLHVGYVLTAPELRELARVALEIAEYLDAQ